MCGRYVSTRSPADLAGLFQVTGGPPEQLIAPSWNVAPTDEAWAVLERAEHGSSEPVRQLRPLRWGLVPSWAKSPDGGARLINARVETVAEKPAFRSAFARRRCLLPADGFYEWQPVPAAGRAKARKQPYFISPEGGGVMALAGLYEFWRDRSAAEDDDTAPWWTTFTVITTDATDAAGRIHPRMPLAVAPADYDAWLDPAHRDPQDVRALLTAPADGHLDARAVSPLVNSVRNNGPELLSDAPGTPGGSGADPGAGIGADTDADAGADEGPDGGA
ncbi:Putative SOS response-associated peptidase YedK [Streptomyces sp. DvalAA-14]|uniref:SOS response-associated peptidase n=1 Tax=unclassified Streptomyces TaxID=2593676 RepID=UPI00081B1C7C|nr:MULTISPECIES: SOS response-associated peptidase [unclassified Streptomyces]MYS22927.1 SOS response-associated peptidase [Streptomyces sp. SID4948]SCE24702.1 Putative SOS response-associated peptidase YedK [Streptomyces sp. DvalAA-14]